MLRLSEVTWYSKLIAITFFLGILPSWAFYIGMIYQQTIDISEAGEIVTDKKFIPRSTPPVATSTPEVVTSASLRVGQSAKINGVQITFLGIEQESRCPIDVQCIQAGSLAVLIKLQKGIEIQRVVLESTKTYEFLNTIISIESVTPDNISTLFPSSSDYVLTFKVDSL